MFKITFLKSLLFIFCFFLHILAVCLAGCCRKDGGWWVVLNSFGWFRVASIQPDSLAAWQPVSLETSASAKAFCMVRKLEMEIIIVIRNVVAVVLVLLLLLLLLSCNYTAPKQPEESVDCCY